METTKLMNTHKCKQLDDLPEDILLYILSLLPLEDTIRTSVLSTRWKYLWTRMPIFDFTHPILTTNISAIKKAQLLDTIERAFAFRDSSSLTEFHLHFSLEDLKDMIIVNGWINAASVKYNVQCLYLSLHPSSMMMEPSRHQLLPSCVFHGRLKELSLEFSDGPCAIELPSPLHLPCLKVLHFKGVELKDEEKLRKLFSLSTLEVLKINECSCSDNLYISAPKLRELYILEGYGENTYQVLIRGCSSLEYFQYVGPRFCVTSLSLWTITSAVIHINVRYKDEERSDDLVASLYKLLKGFSRSVRYLELSSNLVEVLNSRIELLDRLPVFQNISELKFGSWIGITNFNIATLAAILRCMPHLQTLQFLEEVELSETVEKKDYILDPIPSCCELHLKSIIILDFGSTEEEWSIIGILLATAKVLENIVLKTTQWRMPIGKEWSTYNKEVLNRLSELPRASRHCKFSII